MDYTDWMIIRVLAKEKNLTATAEKLFISQPALTYRIKRIEKEFNTTIFTRTAKGVFLTSHGILVAKYVNDMLKKYGEIRDIVSSADGTPRGVVYVAVSPAFARYKLASLLVKFREKYPSVDIYINTVLSTGAIELLMRDEVHLAIVRGNYDLNTEIELLSEEPITLISKNKVSFKSLPNLPYIWYVTDENLEREISNWWREHYDVSPKTIMHINDSLTCRKLVSSGLGFSILPSIENDNDQNNYDFYKINLKKKNGMPLLRSTYLVYKKPVKKFVAAQVFIDFLHEHMKEN